MTGAFSRISSSETQLHEPAQDPASLRRWATFHTLFPLGVILLLAVDALAHGSTTHVAEVLVITAAFAAIWFAGFAVRRRYPGTANFTRYLLPLILYPVIYGLIHAMVTAARPSENFLIDDILHRIDLALFDTDPIVWLGTHGHPLLTDLLHLTYFSYYFGMPVLMILMFRSNRRGDFHRALAAMIMGWYGALITYALFPALGPIRWMSEQLPPLSGVLPVTAWVQGFLAANLTPAVRDCVPSMHTGVTLLTLIFAFRFQRRYFWLFLAPGLGIITATMYIQAHYVIDVILGIGAAGVIYWLSGVVYPERSPSGSRGSSS
jgi:hypothetical protein